MASCNQTESPRAAVARCPGRQCPSCACLQRTGAEQQLRPLQKYGPCSRGQQPGCGSFPLSLRKVREGEGCTAQHLPWGPGRMGGEEGGRAGERRKLGCQRGPKSKMPRWGPSTAAEVGAAPLAQTSSCSCRAMKCWTWRWSRQQACTPSALSSEPRGAASTAVGQ